MTLSQIISAKYFQTCLPSFRRGRGRLLGEAFHVTPLRVTRYIFDDGNMQGAGGRESLLLYIIYIIYNNNFIYILIYNLFTLKIYILLLFVLLCLFLPLNSTNFYPLINV